MFFFHFLYLINITHISRRRCCFNLFNDNSCFGLLSGFQKRMKNPSFEDLSDIQSLCIIFKSIFLLINKTTFSKWFGSIFLEIDSKAKDQSNLPIDSKVMEEKINRFWKKEKMKLREFGESFSFQNNFSLIVVSSSLAPFIPKSKEFVMNHVIIYLLFQSFEDNSLKVFTTTELMNNNDCESIGS